MKTKCLCNYRFDAEIKNKTVSEDILEIYYECPRCGEQFHIAYTTEKIKKYEEEINRIRTELLKDNNKQLHELMKSMMIRHGEMMDKLNEERMMSNA